MNTTACATKWASSPELDNGFSSAVEIGERPSVFHEPEADAKPKLTLFDRPVYDLLKKPGDVTELRILGVYGNSHAWSGYAKGTVAGWFDNHADLCSALAKLNPKTIRYEGVYFTPQVINPNLIGRACNRLVVAKYATTDQDVLAYRFLPVDLDPLRLSGISSSGAELNDALKLRDEIADPIASDLKLPDPIRAISGNGGHLLYPLPDLPAKEWARAVKQMLEHISKSFSTDKVQIDSTVFNPARIWKAYGTLARKGDPVPAGPNRDARPHRLAFIDYLPPAGGGQ